MIFQELFFTVVVIKKRKELFFKKINIFFNF